MGATLSEAREPGSRGLLRQATITPGLNLTTPGVSGGPLLGLTCVSARTVLGRRLHVRCFRTWPAQLVAFGGEVAALSKEEEGTLVI